jgi:hypothetical protein
MDLAAQFRAIGAVPNVWVEWMCARVERYTRAEECARAYGDETSVYHSAIKVDEDVLAKFYIGSVVSSKGCLYPWLVFEKSLVLIFSGRRWRQRRLVVDNASNIVSVCLRVGQNCLRTILSPHLDLLPSCRETCIVEFVTRFCAASSCFDQFWCECVVELSTQGAGQVLRG